MRTKDTLAAELSSTRIRWDRPGEGHRLAAAYWKRKALEAHRRQTTPAKGRRAFRCKSRMIGF